MTSLLYLWKLIISHLDNPDEHKYYSQKKNCLSSAIYARAVIHEMFTLFLEDEYSSLFVAKTSISYWKFTYLKRKITQIIRDQLHISSSNCNYHSSTYLLQDWTYLAILLCIFSKKCRVYRASLRVPWNNSYSSSHSLFIRLRMRWGGPNNYWYIFQEENESN